MLIETNHILGLLFGYDIDSGCTFQEVAFVARRLRDVNPGRLFLPSLSIVIVVRDCPLADLLKHDVYPEE
jgi:hypothetical protein